MNVNRSLVVSNSAPILADPSDPKSGANSKILREALVADAQGNVNEEQLQNGIVEKLLAEKSSALSDEYSSVFIGAQQQGLSVEDSVKFALKIIVQSGKLSQAEAEEINGISFEAAQLDSDRSALFDSRGSESDHTIAIAGVEDAIRAAEEKLELIEKGELSIEARSLDAPSNIVQETNSSGSSQGGEGGFLWKPESERDGNLVVLLPSSLSGNVENVGIFRDLPPSSETLIETGSFSSIANGGRAHFRFDNPGSAYPDGVYVVAQLSNGQASTFQVGDTSVRTEK